MWSRLDALKTRQQQHRSLLFEFCQDFEEFQLIESYNSVTNSILAAKLRTISISARLMHTTVPNTPTLPAPSRSHSPVGSHNLPRLTENAEVVHVSISRWEALRQGRVFWSESNTDIRLRNSAVCTAKISGTESGRAERSNMHREVGVNLYKHLRNSLKHIIIGFVNQSHFHISRNESPAVKRQNGFVLLLVRDTSYYLMLDSCKSLLAGIPPNLLDKFKN